MPALYLFPFDANQHSVSIIQGFNGPYSHFDHQPRYGTPLDLTYALDFALPLGTEVRAARGGHISVAYTLSQIFYNGMDASIGNGLFFATNFIVIEHNDNTCGLYSHLAYGSRQVHEEEFVDQGQLLAYTGQSGWIGHIPHLHFMVYTRSSPQYIDGRVQSGRRITIPVQFKNYDGPLEHQEIFP